MSSGDLFPLVFHVSLTQSSLSTFSGALDPKPLKKKKKKIRLNRKAAKIDFLCVLSASPNVNLHTNGTIIETRKLTLTQSY